MPIRQTILAWTANPPGDHVLSYNVYEHVGNAAELMSFSFQRVLRRTETRSSSPALRAVKRKLHIPDESYVLIGSSITTTYFLDQTGQAPGDHFYVVTAVDDQNRESGYSNEVVVSVFNWRIK